MPLYSIPATTACLSGPWERTCLNAKQTFIRLSVQNGWQTFVKVLQSGPLQSCFSICRPEIAGTSWNFGRKKIPETWKLGESQSSQHVFLCQIRGTLLTALIEWVRCHHGVVGCPVVTRILSTTSLILSTNWSKHVLNSYWLRGESKNRQHEVVLHIFPQTWAWSHENGNFSSTI